MASSSWRCSPWLSADAGQIGARAQAHTRECGAGGIAQFGLAARIAPEAERVAGVRLHRQRDIVEHAQIEKQRGDLKRARKPERAARVHRQRRNIVAAEINAAGVGRELAAQLRDQCRFAGAVRTDHGMQFALGDAEDEIVGRHDATEALGEVLDPQQISHGAPCRAGHRCRRARTTRRAATLGQE